MSSSSMIESDCWRARSGDALSRNGDCSLGADRAETKSLDRAVDAADCGGWAVTGLGKPEGVKAVLGAVDEGESKGSRGGAVRGARIDGAKRPLELCIALERAVLVVFPLLPVRPVNPVRVERHSSSSASVMRDKCVAAEVEKRLLKACSMASRSPSSEGSSALEKAVRPSGRSSVYSTSFSLNPCEGREGGSVLSAGAEDAKGGSPCPLRRTA